jgi:hypothetical protein
MCGSTTSKNRASVRRDLHNSTRRINLAWT